MENNKESFEERWKVKLLQLFKKTEKRREQENEERNAYINFIIDYTNTHGVRETARRLEDAGFKISHGTISEIRNFTDKYDTEWIADLARSISELENEEKNKKN